MIESVSVITKSDMDLLQQTPPANTSSSNHRGGHSATFDFLGDVVAPPTGEYFSTEARDGSLDGVCLDFRNILKLNQFTV